MRSALLLLPLLITVCAQAQKPLDQSGTGENRGTITVEGRAAVSGNMPFTTIVLITDDEEAYFLEFAPATRDTLDAVLPKRLRATGTLFIRKLVRKPASYVSVQTFQVLPPPEESPSPSL